MTNVSSSGCWFCEPAVRTATGMPPGGWIYEDTYWRAGHVPADEYGPRGTVIVEARRHFLDTSAMTPDEAASFGPVLGRITSAVRRATGAERVYTWASMVAHPHLHVWLVPWRSEHAEAGIPYLSRLRAYACSEDEARETAGLLRKALEPSDQPVV